MLGQEACRWRNDIMNQDGAVDRKDLMKAGLIVAIIGGIIISVIVLLFNVI